MQRFLFEKLGTLMPAILTITIPYQNRSGIIFYKPVTVTLQRYKQKLFS